MIDKCKSCDFSREISSENGFYTVCLLSPDKLVECLKNDYDYYTPKDEECDEIVCHCNMKENAELIAKIMDYDVESKVCTDVVEVKHGEWKKGKYETDCICSQCNAEYAMPGKTNFCPNCGADMRERKETE